MLAFFCAEGEVTPKHLQLLEGKDLVEEEIGRVVLIELNLATICILMCYRMIEEPNQHRRVFIILRVQALLFTNVAVLQRIARVLIQVKVVLFAQELYLDVIWTLIGSLIYQPLVNRLVST